MTPAKIATVEIRQMTLMVALADIEHLEGDRAQAIVRKVEPHYPGRPVMLVAVAANGFRAHASFQTHELLVDLQREELIFEDIDLDDPLPEEELPF